MTSARDPWRIVAILAFTQVTSWGSVHYAFTILAPHIQSELGWRPEIVFGAFSWSLLVAGLVSTPVGVLLDRFGGRSIMGGGSLICSVGLALLALSHSIVQYFFAWSILGIAMALVLYEAAFATINREFLLNARKGVSTLTFFGGLASTVFWPLTLYLNNQIGWRNTYLLYGGIQLVLCMPVHFLMPVGERIAKSAHEHTTQRHYSLKEALRHSTFWKLAIAFAANSFIFAALSVHLIPLLQRLGHPVAMAVLLSTLIGPMQVAGRIGEMAFAKKIASQTSGKFCFAVLPPAVAALILFGRSQAIAACFCVLYGLSNGIVTIARGTIPRELYGRTNYGAISGALSGPSLFAKAAGPIAIAMLIASGANTAWVLSVFFLLSAISLACFLAAVRRK